MQKGKKSWRESLLNGTPHVVKPAPKDFADIKAGEIMLIPSAKIVDQQVRKIPKGQCQDIKTLRAELAKKFKADKACPVMTGISLRIAAEAACEELEHGMSIEDVAPFWRVLNKKSPSTAKLACGEAFVLQQREAEGLD